MFISVIIPTYHDWDRLALCFSALKKQDYPQNKFEIIVVNNDPNDQVPENFEIPENGVILAEGKPGSYAARNKALSVAQGEIYAFTDSDCQPQLDWLASAVNFFESNPLVSRIGGKIDLIYKSNKPTVSEVYEKAYAFRQKDFVKNKGMAATGNMIAKKEVFDSIGVFNGNLMSGGDAEWGMRAHKENFKITYLEQCVVWHPTRSLLSDIVQKTKREAGGHFYLIKKVTRNRLILNLLAGFLPPMKSIFRTFTDSNLTMKEKCIAVVIRYYLRLISTIEIMKLLLDIKKVERV